MGRDLGSTNEGENFGWRTCYQWNEDGVVVEMEVHGVVRVCDRERGLQEGYSLIADASLPLPVSLAQNQSHDHSKDKQAGMCIFWVTQKRDMKKDSVNLYISVLSDIGAQTTKRRWKSFQDGKNPPWKDDNLGERSSACLMTKSISLHV